MIQTIEYSYTQNFKGWFITPDKPGRVPVIIYNYDQAFDWLGEKAAKKQGYDVKEIMRTMARRGYAVFVPVERYRKILAIKGAVEFLKKQSQIDLTQLHVLGVSEGAFLSLLALSDLNTSVRSLTAISPTPLNDTGHFSLSELILHADAIQCPVLIITGKWERKWTKHRVAVVKQILEEHNIDVEFEEYPVDKEAFWKADTEYMTRAYDFMGGH